MRILFTSQRVPYPPDRGDKITTYHEVRYLSKFYEVEVFCLADGKEDLQNVEPLRRVAGHVTAIPINPVTSKLRCLFSLLTNAPLTVAYCGESKLKRAILNRHRNAPFDTAIIYGSTVAQFAEPLKSIPRFMQFADLDSMKWEERSKRSGFPLNFVFSRETRLLSQYEARIAHNFHHSFLCTEVEVSDFKKRIPGAPVSCIPNGVDTQYFSPQPDVAKKKGNMVFTGVMDYEPNVDAVKWFAMSIFPEVKKTIPYASFTICGSRPNAAVSELTKIEGIEVTGRVPDVRPYLSRADICVVPIRLARGIQNKLLEAMSMGLPCISTPTVTRALVTGAQASVAVAENESNFAAETIRLLNNPTDRSERGKEARIAVEKWYNWDAKLELLQQHIKDAVHK